MSKEYIVTSNKPGKWQCTTRIEEAAKPETAIRRARAKARWPEDATVTAVVRWSEEAAEKYGR